MSFPLSRRRALGTASLGALATLSGERPALAAALPAAPGTSLRLEQLTWTELRDRIAAGADTVLLPIGGTEQNGPHMALGKHNLRARMLAGRIATALGRTVVAPVIAYVPEGRIAPPAAHMRFAGTITIPDEAFRATLDSAARSFWQHGFKDVVFVGEHGGYQSQIKTVAERLNRDWAGTPARAHYIAEYYRSAQVDYAAALRAQGITQAQFGSHAGAGDTSLLLALDATMVRSDQLSRAAREGLAVGVSGDPRPATAALGQIGVDLIVTQSVAAIRSAIAERR
jgi:creatinine amidohydrolase/Fe(II)-dependent formamide hydrolase-like protein